MAACSAAANGRPTTMVTGRGKCFGIFQKNLPPLKLNKEPHMPSIASGTTGASPRRAISSNPLRSGRIPPFRVRLPSGKMQTTSPALSASADFWIASLAFVSATGMVPMVRVRKRITGRRSKPSQERKRTGRRDITPTRRTST